MSDIKKIYKKIINWKILTVVITFITSLLVSIKLIFKKDDIDDRVKRAEKTNKRLIDESANYADKRMQFYEKHKKRALKEL